MLKMGFALCGSYCSFDSTLPVLEELCGLYDVTPIMSENAYTTDTRFGKAADFVSRIEDVTGKKVIHTIPQAEAFGPSAPQDILVIAPCTGNTLGKLANGITDTCVTMAAKAHLRNQKPLVAAIATNDGMSGSAVNIGRLLQRRSVYFVPLRQDDVEKKPSSLVCDFRLIPRTVANALEGRQIRPLFL